MNDNEVYNLPVSVQLNTDDGVFAPCVELVTRKVSDLNMMFYDKPAVEENIRQGDHVVYEIRYHPFITSTSDMALGTTTIFPGKIGDEYHMTKGHFHESNDQPEIYHCVRGEGILQMMSAEGEYYAAAWKPNTITHIPPQFAHRVVNTGTEPLVFVAVFHVAAGHDYRLIELRGFKYRIVDRHGKAVEQLNPNWA